MTAAAFDPAKLAPDVVAAIRAHAVRDYPNESCGAITADGYLPFKNVTQADPKNPHSGPRYFFNCDDQMHPLWVAGSLLALVHSHPDGAAAPSGLDMQTQIAMDIPWGIVVSDKEGAEPPWWWSDGFAPPPLLGRGFRHGPSGTDGKGDCFALIRDWYRLERGITLPDTPRDENWWRVKDAPNLYSDGFAAAGFSRVDRRAPEVGDAVLMAISSHGKPCHGGIYVGDGNILHHLPNRLSRIEPVGRWLKNVTHWLRHESAPA